MSYYNIPFKYGIGSFVSSMARLGLQGAILPDLPPEKAVEYLKALEKHQLSRFSSFRPLPLMSA